MPEFIWAVGRSAWVPKCPIDLTWIATGERCLANNDEEGARECFSRHWRQVLREYAGVKVDA